MLQQKKNKKKITCKCTCKMTIKFSQNIVFKYLIKKKNVSGEILFSKRL